jgi:hypothetical protein
MIYQPSVSAISAFFVDKVYRIAWMDSFEKIVPIILFGSNDVSQPLPVGFLAIK